MNFPTEVLERLKTYQDLLVKWQTKINLVSPNTIENAWKRHFLDSIQINKIIPAGTKILFDLGCGAGFPGLVLAMINPDLDVHLVESDQKKCSFLKTVSRETTTKVTVHNLRIENFKSDIKPDIITARALADLPKLFQYCEKWITANPSVSLIFPKGERADEELRAAQKQWNFECKEFQSETDSSSKILKFTDIIKK